MIWTTWRQHRAEAAVGAVIVGALAVAMIVIGTTARDRARSLGLPGCSTSADCGNAVEKLHYAFRQIPPFTGLLIAVPLLLGMFWAGPLVSREYEAGTYRLAWTQSVSPLRWITTKISLIFAFAAAAALTLGLLAGWTLDPLGVAFGGRYNSTWFDVQGIVPVACTVFALSVGVAASALIRRTVPAMAVTLLAYAAARIPVHWIRAHFAPVTTRNRTVSVAGFVSDPGGRTQGFSIELAPNDWLLSVTATDATGKSIPTTDGQLGVLLHYCPDITRGSDDSIQIGAACQSTLQHASFRETVRYQPASHFWLIQTVESAIFLGLAALLVGGAILAVTRRRPR